MTDKPSKQKTVHVYTAADLDDEPQPHTRYVLHRSIELPRPWYAWFAEKFAAVGFTPRWSKVEPTEDDGDTE